MDAARFVWLRRTGFAPAALAPEGFAPPKPLEAEALDGATLVWLPLDHVAQTQRALHGLHRDVVPLFPAAPGDVPAVVDAWLDVHGRAGAGLEEAVLQVHDDTAHLRDYLAAERALWAQIYAAHPHKEDPGILPRALDEAAWLLDAVLEHPAYEDKNEFLTQNAFETVARELLLVVRKAELQHLRDHLRDLDTVSGW